MTKNKRFTLINWDNYAEGDCIYYDNGEEMGSLDVLDTLNGFDGTIKDLSDDYQRLMEENKKLKELVIEVDNELEIRDIVCGAGKFRLEEWGKHRYHQFYKGDEELEDETVVIMLMELEKENKELKEEIEELEDKIELLEGKL